MEPNKWEARIKWFTLAVMCFYNCDPFSVYRNDYKIKSMHYRLHNRPEFQTGEDNFSRLKRRTRVVFLYILAFWWIKYTCLIVEQQIISNNPLYTKSLIGNPFPISDGHGSIGSYFILILSLALTHALFIIPSYYTRVPMDSISIRMLLEPQRELERIDSAIGEKIENIRKQTRAIIIYREQADIKMLRPAIYNLNWHGPRASKVLPGFWLYAMLLTPVAIASIPTIILDARSAVCKMKRIDPCPLFEDFTRAQFITTIELTLAVYVLAIVTELYLLLSIVSVFNQLIIAKSVKRDMNKCLAGLIFHNQHKIQPMSIHNEKQIDKNLLKNYIRLSLSAYEIKRGTRFSTENFSLIGVIYAIAAAFALIAAYSRGNELQILWQFFFVSIWGATNVYVFMGAYSYARASAIEKIGWSILAQMTIRNKQRKQFAGIDYITTSWMKLVFSLASSNDENKIRPFNVPLTYRTLIHLNLLVSSIVTLFNSHSFH